MMNDLAPIGVSTYARLQHLQQTIAALQKNTLAQQSELFVFSDAPKPGDEERVAAVRRYLRTVDGFKMIHVVERESNSRTENNRGGLRTLLDRFGKVIFLEEDVVTAPAFLHFMNAALERYEEEKRVFSVTGWCPKFKEEIPLAKGSTFFVPRFCAWGMGIWKDRYDKIKKISIEDVEALQKDHVALSRINKQMGRDVFAMIQAEALGKINALDIRCCYHQAVTGELTLYPYPSLVRNIGLDGTGEHCGEQLADINGEFEERSNMYMFPDNFIVNKEIASVYAEVFVRKISLLGRLKRLGLRFGNKVKNNCFN